MEIVREAARDGRRQITIIVVAFILLAFAASVINPLHEATDELRHYRFVQHIVQLRRLPVQGEMACQAQGHHPPLFYLLGTLATFWIDTGQDVCYEPPTNPFWQYRYWEVGNDNKNLYMPRSDAAFPWSGEALAAHLVRGVNILLGALTVLLTWLMARVIWLKRPSIALGTAAFVAFNPMFVFMSGAINNDVIAALGGTAVLLACIVLVKEPDGLSRKWGVALGLLYGLALMSKFNLAPLGLLIGLAVTFTAWQKKQWRLWLEVALLSLGTVAMIAGWWFVRNQMLYGEPTGFQRLTELWGKRNPAESVRLAIYELPYTWTSLWGRFGYGQIPLPEPIYIGLRWLVGVGLLGLIVPIAQRQWDELRPIGIPLVLLALDVLLFFGVLFNYLLVSPAGAMGRFFFPALPALAILTFYGLSRWLDLAKAKLPITKLAWATNILLAGLTIVTLWGYLQPAYARPSSFTIDTVVPHPTNAQFDNLVKLRGYDVNTTAVQPGDVLELELYWEVTGQPPGNYLMFLHLIDENGIMVAQRDTHPGLGNFPSGRWQPGDQFVDKVRLHIPETMYTPSTADLSLGLYVPDGYRLGITAADGSGLGDALVLETITLQSAAGEAPNPIQQNFNDKSALVGYEYNTQQLQPGDVLAVNLYWQALQKLDRNYEVEMWVCDEPCEKWMSPRAAAVHPLHPPTSAWQPGQTISDTVQLSLPGDIPAGTYFIHVALIDPMTKEPQNILADDGHILDNRLLLARVRLTP